MNRLDRLAAISVAVALAGPVASVALAAPDAPNTWPLVKLTERQVSCLQYQRYAEWVVRAVEQPGAAGIIVELWDDQGPVDQVTLMDLGDTGKVTDPAQVKPGWQTYTVYLRQPGESARKGIAAPIVYQFDCGDAT